MKYKNEWVLTNGRYHNRPDMTLYFFNGKMKAEVKGYVMYSDVEKKYFCKGKKEGIRFFRSPSEAKKWMLNSYKLMKVREIARSKLGDDYTKARGGRW